MYRRNASASSADTTAATELALFAANDGDLYRSQAQPIITNLAKKMSKGQYDEAKAAKLWGYFATSAAKKYAWEFGDRKPGTRSWHQQSIDGNGMFNAATRRFASAELEQHYRDEVTSLATTARLSERKNGTRRDVLQEDARKSGYSVDTYSPGDGTTRYRFFSLAEMASKGISEREQSYFGPLNGVHTALGLAAAKKWLARASSPRNNPRVNKYEYLSVLQGHYAHGWEDLFTVERKGSGIDRDASREMKAIRKDYQSNAPGTAYRVISRKVVR